MIIKFKWVISFIVIISLCLTLIGCKTKKDKELSILFIGNSMTFMREMPDLLAAIGVSKDKYIHVDYDLCQGGFTLKDFWDAGAALKKIELGQWDYVVLQEQSQQPINNKENFHTYVRLFQKEIQSADAKTILYINNTRGSLGKIIPDTQKLLTQSYEEIAQEVNAIIVPAGPAWVELYQVEPNLSLYVSDNIHPSITGAYLTACVFYGVLFDESPEGASSEMLKDAGLTDKALVLQKTAWKTVNRHRTFNDNN